jgi:hypothetical protein
VTRAQWVSGNGVDNGDHGSPYVIRAVAAGNGQCSLSAVCG